MIVAKFWPGPVVGGGYLEAVFDIALFVEGPATVIPRVEGQDHLVVLIVFVLRHFVDVVA